MTTSPANHLFDDYLLHFAGCSSVWSLSVLIFGALQEILTGVDDLLYVDTDTLFLSPTEEIWHLFEKFNSSHLVALTQEAETPGKGWYVSRTKTPYYPPTGECWHQLSGMFLWITNWHGQRGLSVSTLSTSCGLSSKYQYKKSWSVDGAFDVYKLWCWLASFLRKWSNACVTTKWAHCTLLAQFGQSWAIPLPFLSMNEKQTQRSYCND